MSKVTIVVGTVYGGCEIIANLATKMLKRTGHSATVLLDAKISQVQAAEKLLFITSTTGQGDFPDNIMGLIKELMTQAPDLSSNPYGLMAFGDRGYGKTFCRAGREVHALLGKLKGDELLEHLEVDAMEYLDPEEPVIPWLNDYITCL